MPAVLQREQELLGAVLRDVAARDGGRRDAETARRAPRAAPAARSVIAAKSVDAAPVAPSWKIWRGPVALGGPRRAARAASSSARVSSRRVRPAASGWPFALLRLLRPCYHLLGLQGCNSFACNKLRPFSNSAFQADRLPMVVRDVLDNGLRLLTESMPHVRSVSLGVWLTRGSRHEGDAVAGHRALRRAHALQGHDDADRPRTSRRTVDSIGGQMDASTGKENAELRHQGPRRAPAAGGGRPVGRRAAPRASTPDDIEREKRRGRRRDQDGRGHARRPRARAVPRSSSGPAIRWAGPILGTAESVSRLTEACCATTSRGVYTADNLIVARPPATSSTRRVRDADRAGVRPASPADGAAAGRGPAGRERASSTCATKDLEQSHICLGVGRLPRRATRTATSALRAQHAARRVDELAAVPERAREARAGLLGGQRPERLPRRGPAERSTPGAANQRVDEVDAR
ncbi:MAG: hypothetical protein MZV64_04585 [Ignavibacteriales bacterium]|nr:hypothetical protein [Ignavibacteriales bacterium]